MKNQRIEYYGIKDQQSQLYRSQEKECHVWLTLNLNPGKTAAVMKMLEQIVETRAWIKVRELIDGNIFRVCNQCPKTVEHLVAGCAKLANAEYQFVRTACSCAAKTVLSVSFFNTEYLKQFQFLSLCTNSFLGLAVCPCSALSIHPFLCCSLIWRFHTL